MGSTTWPSPSGPARRSGPSPCPEPPVLFLDPLLRPSGMLSSLPLWLLLLPFSTPLLPFPFPEPFPVLFPAPLLRLSGTSSSLPLLQLPEGRGGLSPCPVPLVLFPDPLLRPSGMLSSLPFG